MAYLDRWKTIFPEVVGSEARPDAPIDNTLALNTDGFPQFIANDPVGYALQNAFLMQLFSNDARLGELIDSLDDDFTAHLTDVNAHSKGIAGNAASATKLKTARDIKVNLESESAASFDGTNAVNPGVDGVLPVAHGGTGETALSSVTVGKANQLTTARTIDGVDFNGTAAISHFGVSDTAAATAAKTVACAGFKLVTGAEIVVRFKNTNSADSPTLNVNGTGAKGIHYRQVAINKGYLVNTRMFRFVYDGVNYQMIGDIDTNTTYSNMTAATASAAGKAGLVPAPAAGKQASFLRGDGTWAVPTDTNTDTKVTNTAVAPTTEATYYITGSTNSATETGGLNKSANFSFKIKNGTTSAEGYTTLGLGNSTATGAANNQTGRIYMYNNKGKYTYIYPHAGDTENRTVYLPKSGGTLVAHTTDTAIGGVAKPVYVSAAGVATACSSDVGSATQPVYMNDGTITKCTYTLSKSVPSDAKFTDTTYSTFVKSGSTAAAGLVPAPSTTAGTTKYLREDGTWSVPPDNNTTYSNFVKSGSGAKAGLVPAPSTTAGTTKYLREDGTWQVPPDHNTTYSNMTAATASAAGKAGLVPAPAAGKQGQFLRGDGTWQTPTNTTYSAGTTAQLTTGTDTANRVWPAKQIADYVKGTTSLAQNGYWKAPNGLIIQWGNVPDVGLTDKAITFPISFSTACYSVSFTYCKADNGGAGSNNNDIVRNPTKTGMTVYMENYCTAYWIAIGK